MRDRVVEPAERLVAEAEIMVHDLLRRIERPRLLQRLDRRRVPALAHEDQAELEPRLGMLRVVAHEPAIDLLGV